MVPNSYNEKKTKMLCYMCPDHLVTIFIAGFKRSSISRHYFINFSPSPFEYTCVTNNSLSHRLSVVTAVKFIICHYLEHFFTIHSFFSVSSPLNLNVPIVQT